VSEAPRYLVTDRSYIGLGVVEEGAEVEYSGLPGAALQPLNAAAKDAKAQALAARSPANADQYILRAPVMDALGVDKVVPRTPAPKADKTARDPTGQGTIRDPGGSDPAMPFDPAQEGPDHTPVNLPEPAEDTETPGRAKAQTAAQKKAAAAQAAAKEKAADLT
jgi:hypothetical protein